MRPETKKVLIGYLAVGLAALLIAPIAGFIVGYFFSHDEALMQVLLNRVAPVVMGLIAVGGMAGGLWTGVLWMRSIDEAAREAHKSAWFWGGSAGMAIGGVVVIMTFLPQSANWVPPITFFGRTDPAAYAASGAYAMMLVMLAGYGV
ncbi:hypothetical protein LTR94_031936, partial [Friedmanniomyces endolithicus]